VAFYCRLSHHQSSGVARAGMAFQVKESLIS
jgi:hypothetical protein